MKRLLGFFSILSVVIIFAAIHAQAKDNSIYMNAAYWKGGDKFDVVAKETPGIQIKLYVNDKNPVSTTVNSQGWATFSGVSLSGSGKISFTWVDGSQNEHPIDYTNKFSVSDPKATFVDDTPVSSKPEPITTPTPSPAPTPAPQPQAAAPTKPAPAVYYKKLHRGTIRRRHPNIQGPARLCSTFRPG